MERLASTCPKAEIKGSALNVAHKMKDESFVVFCHFLSDMFQILSKMSMHFQCNDLILPSALAILRETTENIKMLTKRSSPGGKMEAIRSSLAKQQDDRQIQLGALIKHEKLILLHTKKPKPCTVL